MLVLSRDVGEKVVIDVNGTLIYVVVVENRKHGKTRLGFEADRSVTIHREEVWKAIQAAKGEPQ